MTRWLPLRGRIPAMRGPCSALRVATIRYGDYPSASLRAGSEQLALTPALSQRGREKRGEMADERTRPPYSQKSPVSSGYDWLPSPQPSPASGPERFIVDGDELVDHYRHALAQLGKQEGLQ
jgi:hypothetical protein